MATQPAYALPAMSVPFFTIGPIVYVNPTQAASLTVIEANATHLSSADTEALGISFPSGGTASAPCAMTGIAFPSGMAAGPSIAQTDSEEMAYDRMYLFQDFTSG